MRQSARAIVIKDNQLLVIKRNKFGQKYLSLPGGEIDLGEKPTDTVLREIDEETSIKISNPRLVILEDCGRFFGLQYIFLCDFLSGEPALRPDSTEFLISQKGENIYEPGWIATADLEKSNLLPIELKDTLVKFIKEGFPDQPVDVRVRSMD